jgi:DNA-binding transcriptional MerR regulator
MSEEMRIGEVARRSGVAASSIRFYESIGLLPEPGRESGQRRYGDDVLGTLSFIGTAQEAGFTLREIGALMSGRDHLRDLSSRKLAEVQALIERAEQMRRWLHKASACACPTPDECTLFPEPGEVTLGVVEVEGCRRAVTRPRAGSP